MKTKNFWKWRGPELSYAVELEKVYDNQTPYKSSSLINFYGEYDGYNLIPISQKKYQPSLYHGRVFWNQYLVFETSFQLYL